MKTHCDVVVEVQPGSITAVGGNVDNSVSRKTIPLSSTGQLAAPGYFAVIKVGGFPGSSVPVTPTPSPLPPQPAPPVAGGQTVYAPIDLGIRQARVVAQTGIFCPPGFRPSQRIDVVVYLHGIREPQTTTIESYWNASRNPHFALREEFAKSRRNALLLVPLLGPRSQDQIGLLAQPGGFDQWLRQAVGSLQSQGRIPASATIGNIILACHSGGGHAMRLIVSAQNQLSSSIRECWGFDCTYGARIRPDDATFWSAWARQDPSRRLFVYYQQSTSNQSQKLQGRQVPNIVVEHSNARNHNWVPRTHFLPRLTSTTALSAI
jgi:hypothetical protein